MIILDTDHFTVLEYDDDPRAAELRQRLAAATDPDVATTIITFEEQMRGWLARINRERDPVEQAAVYERLLRLATAFRTWRLQSYDGRAARRFVELRRQLRRIGAKDLRIAAVALVNGALLLSANLRDFRQVPGLRDENWIEPPSAPETE